jgi:hypothetical protein
VNRRLAALEAPRVDPKRSVGASERGEFLRAAWRALMAGELHAQWLVFLKDEMASNTSHFSVYAWVPRDKRARCSVARNSGKKRDAAGEHETRRNGTVLVPNKEQERGGGVCGVRWAGPDTHSPT